MVNYKKIVLVTLLSCIAFSFQVQALSRCLTLPYPTSQPMRRAGLPCIYNTDETTLRIAQDILQCLKEKIDHITPLVALTIDYLGPIVKQQVMITKDQLIGSPLQACCLINKARILKEPAIIEPIEGLYKTYFFFGDFSSIEPQVNISLRFSNTEDLEGEAWVFSPLRFHDSSVIEILTGCKECGRIKMEPSYLQNRGAYEICTRKRVGYPLSDTGACWLHDIEITGWNDQASAGTGIAMRIYESTPKVKLWVAFMKLRDDERAAQAVKPSTSSISQDSISCSSQSSSSSSNSCTSAESAARAAKLKD